MIFRNRRTRPLHWAQIGLRARADGGACSDRSKNIGSGLVIDGGVAGERYAGLPLFFTARHVIPGQFRSLPKDLTITFDTLMDDPQGGMARVKRLLAVSPANKLYYSVALLDRWPGQVLPVNLCPRTPAPGDLIFVLGFPGGRGLEVSLHNNEVLASDQQHTRSALPNPADVLPYAAPTEAGSSGSPVFNENWELAAIHMGAARSRVRTSAHAFTR